MIKLFSLKQQKKDAEMSNASSSNANQSQNQKASSAAHLRVSKDLNELNLPKTCLIDFPLKENILDFKLYISPDEGYYRGGKFMFDFKISSNYPHEPPKVKCQTRLYHPNIDTEGNICLNILREDWNPVLTISSIIYGLQYLFLEPNPEDPLNKEAAEMLARNPRKFEQNVQKYIVANSRGNYF